MPSVFLRGFQRFFDAKVRWFWLMLTVIPHLAPSNRPAKTTTQCPKFEGLGMTIQKLHCRVCSAAGPANDQQSKMQSVLPYSMTLPMRVSGVAGSRGNRVKPEGSPSKCASPDAGKLNSATGRCFWASTVPVSDLRRGNRVAYVFASQSYTDRSSPAVFVQD